jgi:hypothetical protein
MQNVNSVMEVLQRYFAGNILLILTMIAFVFWARKNGTQIRWYLTFIAVGILFLFNGISYRLIRSAGESDTYYRLLWILPITLFVAYFIIELLDAFNGWKKIVFIFLCAACLGIYGSVSLGTWLKFPTNIYQLSEDVIGVADVIEVHSGGSRVKMWDEGSIWYSIRQYDDNICWPEGDMDDLYYALISQDPDYTAEEIRQYVAWSMADYIVLRKDMTVSNGWVQEAGFVMIGQTENYNIYYVDQQELEDERTS